VSDAKSREAASVLRERTSAKSREATAALCDLLVAVKSREPTSLPQPGGKVQRGELASASPVRASSAKDREVASALREPVRREEPQCRLHGAARSGGGVKGRKLAVALPQLVAATGDELVKNREVAAGYQTIVERAAPRSCRETWCPRKEPRTPAGASRASVDREGPRSRLSAAGVGGGVKNRDVASALPLRAASVESGEPQRHYEGGGRA